MGRGQLTDVLEVLVGVAVVLGALACLLRRRSRGVGLWIAMMILTWLLISSAVTTWANAKTLVLTSPAVVAAAWAGVALAARTRSRACSASSPRACWRW